MSADFHHRRDGAPQDAAPASSRGSPHHAGGGGGGDRKPRKRFTLGRRTMLRQNRQNSALDRQPVRDPREEMRREELRLNGADRPGNDGYDDGDAGGGGGPGGGRGGSGSGSSRDRSRQRRGRENAAVNSKPPARSPAEEMAARGGGQRRRNSRVQPQHTLGKSAPEQRFRSAGASLGAAAPNGRAVGASMVLRRQASAPTSDASGSAPRGQKFCPALLAEYTLEDRASMMGDSRTSCSDDVSVGSSGTPCGARPAESHATQGRAAEGEDAARGGADRDDVAAPLRSRRRNRNRRSTADEEDRPSLLPRGKRGAARRNTALGLRRDPSLRAGGSDDEEEEWPAMRPSAPPPRRRSHHRAAPGAGPSPSGDGPATSGGASGPASSAAPGVGGARLKGSVLAGADDEDEPVTRPSAPAPRRRTNRAFDLNERRASLMSRLHEDPSAKRFLGSLTVPANKKKLGSSLETCLEDMGFDPADVATAMRATNANSSEDAAKVVAWLGDHEAGGGGGQETKEDVDDDDEYDDEGSSTHSVDETNYTRNTRASVETSDTACTEETQESNPRVQELKENLGHLGFSHADIRRHKEAYRRHSGRMNAQAFISVILDTQEAAGGGGGADGEAGECCPAPAEDWSPAPITPRNDGRSAADDELVRSIAEMGFEVSRVERAIQEMRSSGATVSREDHDKVLGVLLAESSESLGDGAGSSSTAGRSSSAREYSRFDSIDEEEEPPPRNRSNRSLTLPPRQEPRRPPPAEDESLSIEIAPGQFAQLLKGRETWNAMHDGTAMTAMCSTCGDLLQCAPSAHYVLCPDCNVVSPLRAPTSESHVGAVGLGYKREKG